MESDSIDYGMYCGCVFIMLFFNFCIGGWSVNYLLGLLDKTIPFFWAAIIGLFVAEFSIPAAIIAAILKYFL